MEKTKMYTEFWQKYFWVVFAEIWRKKEIILKLMLDR
jgi:hypothetical protein